MQKKTRKKNASVAKKQIYYARTYRHLEFNWKGGLIFGLLFVLPLTILLLFFYDECTKLMCQFAGTLMNRAAGMETELLQAPFIPFLGDVFYLDFPKKLPSMEFVLGNLAASLALTFVFSFGKLKGKPISIYLEITLLVHVMSCVFFLLGSDVFPYEISDYSQLYVQQQVSIWVTFLVLIGIVGALLGRGSVIYRMGIVLVLMAYSFLFGTVRYGLFLWILNRYSILYMPIMFFSLGPFFDFLYFVMIYSISGNKMIKKYDGKQKDEWKWA